MKRIHPDPKLFAGVMAFEVLFDFQFSMILLAFILFIFLKQPYNFRNDERLCRLPLNYLLGAMYTNFTLLWAPLQKLVAGYGNGLKRDLFWNVYAAKLRSASEDIMRFLQEVKERTFVRDEVAANRVDFMKVRMLGIDILRSRGKIKSNNLSFFGIGIN